MTNQTLQSKSESITRSCNCIDGFIYDKYYNAKPCKCVTNKARTILIRSAVPHEILNSVYIPKDHHNYLEKLVDEANPFKITCGDKSIIYGVVKQISIGQINRFIFTTDQELAEIPRMDLERGDAVESPRSVACSRLDTAEILVILLTPTKEKKAQDEVLEWMIRRSERNKACWVIAHNDAPLKFSPDKTSAFKVLNFGQTKPTKFSPTVKENIETARLDCKCAVCGDLIKKGDPIGWTKSYKGQRCCPKCVP